MKLAVVGTVGVPGRYGGFETLAENLVHYADQNARTEYMLTVYCSARAYPDRPATYRGARLRYSRLDANGAQSVLYDIVTALDAACRGHDRLLILGVSGAMVIPLLRLVSRSRIVINIDGIEWQRSKWQGFARRFLRWLEVVAVRFAHDVIADNQAIAEYVSATHTRTCEVIPYGGDHALDAEPDLTAVADLPDRYALALCRIEQENNVAMILEAFTRLGTPLVFVGNWDNSDYGRDLKTRYKDHPNIIIHNPIYEPRGLRAIRDRASMYVHGHSAGGTNPSLVEMMHFDIPILAHGCSFNRHTTEGKARYFMTANELAEAVRSLSGQDAAQIGADMGEIARRRYTWDQIGRAYFNLLES